MGLSLRSGQYIRAAPAVLTLGAVLMALCAYLANREMYLQLIREDGLVENATALLLLLFAVLILVRLLRYRKQSQWLWIISSIFLIGALFFGFWEEISWGQRVFDIETTDFFRNNNLQKENNFHNLEFYGYKINKIIFSLGLGFLGIVYFGISSIIYRLSDAVKTCIDSTGIALPRFWNTLLFFILVLVIYVLPHEKKWELMEASFVACVYLAFVFPYNEVRPM